MIPLAFNRAAPAAVLSAILLAMTSPLAAAIEAPMPRERPKFDSDSKRVQAPTPLPAVVSAEVAEQTRVALNHIFSKRFSEALAVQRELDDPVAIALVEFYYIREAASQVPYQRIAAFRKANPDWPAHTQFRRIGEVALLVQRADPAMILEAFQDEEPITNPGVILHATALAAKGEEDLASDMIRQLWRTANLTEGEERLIRQRFPDVITREDIKFRMDRMAYAGSRAAALRLARELGDGQVKLVEARLAVNQNAAGAANTLKSVPESLQQDPLYQFSKIQHTRRAGENEAAAQLLLTAPRDPEVLADPDVWATERRIVARALAEAGDGETAYRVISGHSAQGTLGRMDSHWHAGWIALRFLDNPTLAATHFEQMVEDAGRPISVSRAQYWLGRAAEAAGDTETATEHFAAAAAHPTTYYGQLALDRVAPTDMAPARKPIHADVARRLLQDREPLRALRLLAQAGYDRLVPGLLMSMAEGTDDPLTLVGLGEIAHLMGHPGASVHIGKQGTYAGAPTEVYAFTRLGIPDFQSVGPAAEPALVYAISRQESLFNTGAVSPAGALGLMQLMPATARETAQRYGLPYNQSRLTSDPAYNAALGSAHLGELVREFGDAYALVFAAYNAGRSRVYQWLKRFGDPRVGEIDPVDWVELIPFTETRNYVQRVMEGLQVYRASLEGEGPLLIARDLRLGDEHRGEFHVADDESDPFAVISEADNTEPQPAGSLGFAPGRASFGFGGGGGGATGSFSFGGQ